MDCDPRVVVLDSGSVEPQVGQLGNPSGTVHDEVGHDGLGSAVGLDRDRVAAATGRLDRDDAGAGSHSDADLFAACNEQIDEIWIEALERPVTVLDDRGVCPGACCDVGELERDEAAANEHDEAR